MENPKEKLYTNGEITVSWKSERCIHSAVCRDGLLKVFNPKARPWINMDAATTEEIIAQVNKCPSGAISWHRNGQKIEENQHTENMIKIEVIPNGPLRVHADAEIHKSDGSVETREKVASYCRCGHSANKPFCDGSHRKLDWKENG